MVKPHLAYFGSSTAIDGGSELCLLRMARHFNDLYRVTLFLPDDGPLFRAATSAGIDCINLRFLRLRRHRGLDWVKWLLSVRKAREILRKECRNREIDLIHFNDFIDLPFYSIAKDLGVPAVTHLRLIVANHWGRDLYRMTVRSAGCEVLAVSQAVSSQMLGSNSSIPHRVLYDPAPDPTHFFPRMDARMGSPFRLTLVSKLLENKGHLNFCEVARSLEERRPGGYAFTVVAPSSPGRQAYEKKVKEALGLLPSERTRFIPGATHAELGDVLRGTDLLLHLPDTEDSFPGVVLEAMACGTPVLGYRVGGLPEQLDNGSSGTLVNPGDFEAIVREVERISTDSEGWLRLSEQGKKRVSTVFSAETHFQLLEEIYRELMNR